MRIILQLLCLLLITLTSNATNYYVDASTTSSTQNGSSTYPWRTLNQVSNNLSSINPGDIISFKRGGTYAGQLIIDRSGTAGNPITFNAYGTGPAPVFSGTGSPITYLFYAYNRAYITFNGLNITDPALSLTDHNQMAKIQRAFYIDGTTNNVIIKNCSVSLAGIGVYLVGSNNTVDSCTIQNLRMVVNTPGGYDDYGANAVLISSSNNKITNNKFLDCWAPSYDFTYDGGALEIYGSNVNNNFIGYNTMVNNCGLIEIASGGSGTCTGTIFAYNKLINNSSLFFIHNQTITVSNLQYYNNVIIETVVQRVYDNYIAAMYSTSGASGMVVLKNNIFWLSTGIDVARSNQFTGSQLIHEDNIYRLGSNSVLNFTQNSSEMVTTANNIFTNTAATDPASWNLTPVTTGPAIDFGQNVGLTKDFVGNSVPTVPNAGLFESAAAQTPALTVNATSGSIACNGGTTTVTVTATGGVAPYNGTGSYTVGAGSYNYTVTDAAGASGTKTITVTQPAVINVSLTSGVINYFGGKTTLTVAASGGSGTYTYQLNSGAYQSSTTFSNIPAGVHTVTVKDAVNCTKTKTITISQPSSTFQITATPGTIACYNGSTTVTVTGSGGTTPYSGAGTFTVSAGNYTYTITDATGASRSATITVSQPQAIAVTVNKGTITSSGGTTWATASASGGSPGYTYKLNSGSYQSSATFNGVGAGNHTITVKDSRGCLSTNTFTIPASGPAPLRVILVAKSDNSCRYTWDGSITAGATGGTAPYTYQISSYGYSTNATFVLLGPNTYNVYAKDATGAVSVMQVQILASSASCSGKIAGKASQQESPIVEPNNEFNIKAYPNPTADVFYLDIKNSETETTSITVMDFNGKIVEQNRVSGNKRVVLGKTISAGTYIVRVQDSKKTQSIRIIKTN